jgi:branched-chain amino acid transport system substrate-binding protein
LKVPVIGGAMRSRKPRCGALIALAVISTACGNRLPAEELRAAAGLSPAQGEVAAPGVAAPAADTTTASAAGTADAAPLPTETGSAPSAAGTPTAGQRPTSAGAARSPSQVASGGGPPAAANPARRGAAGAAGRTPAGTPSGPSAGQPATGAGSSCAPNCAPIVVASVGTYSGIVGQNIGGGVKALQAWVSSVNAKGGINGHPVQLFVADDVGDPARHRALVQQMVEERRAIAFLFNAEVLSGQGSVDYIDRVRVPVIGSEGGGEWFHQNQYYFPQHSSGKDLPLTPMGSATVSQLPQGKKKLGTIVCADGIQVCEDAKKTFPERAPKYGFEYVYNGSASLAQPDLTANCLAAQDAGAQLLLILMDKNSIQRAARSCSNIGYKPVYLLNQTIENDALATDPLLDGAVGSGVVAPWFDTSNPAVVEFREAMAAYAPGVDISGAPMQGWASAKLFEKAAARIGNPPTSEQVLQGLWSMKNETLGGIVPPRTFTQGQPAPHAVCFWSWIVKDKKFVNAVDNKVRCI